MSTRFQISNHMRKARNTRNRPEQMLIAEIIEDHLFPNVTVKTEERIHYITESHQAKWADIDVFVVWQSPENSRPMEYLIRVMGPPHDEPRQTQKDNLQRSYLMSIHPPLRYIATVIDLWYHKMPTTFKRNKTKLRKSELITAYHEISKQTRGLFYLPEHPNESWLLNSNHLK